MHERIKIFICASMLDKNIRSFYIPDPKKEYIHNDVSYSQFPFSGRIYQNVDIPIDRTLTHFESVGLIHATKTKTHLFELFAREERLKSKYNGLSIEDKRSAIDEECKKSSWSIR